MSGSATWTTLAQDRFGHQAQVLHPGAVQNVAFTAGAAAPSSAFSAGVSVVRLLADQDCWITIGQGAVASPTSSTRLSAFDKEYWAVLPGEVVSVRGVSGSGSLNITEC